MGRKSAEAQVIIHEPETEEESRQLARLTAGLHADMVIEYIQGLSCPARQKLELLDTVIRAAEEGKK